MTTALKHPRDWEYVIIADSAITGSAGESLPPFMGPFASPGLAESWGSRQIHSGRWHVTDLATPNG